MRPAAVVSAGIDIAVGGVRVLGALVASPFLRDRYNTSGARPAEVGGALPGDDLVPAPVLGYTRAVTIDANTAAVWPWLAQIGQGRGGLYSYDGLENLLGCRIHSADAVLPEHQDLRPGALIRLGPDGYPAFRVQDVDPPTTLVLVSAGPGAAYRTGETDVGDAVVTWQWLLRPIDGGRRSRLLVRQRLSCPPSQRLMWRVVEPIGFVMERRMLHGLARRAERDRRAAPGDTNGLPTKVRSALLGAGMKRRLVTRLAGLDLPTEPRVATPVTENDIRGLPGPGTALPAVHGGPRSSA